MPAIVLPAVFLAVIVAGCSPPGSAVPGTGLSERFLAEDAAGLLDLSALDGERALARDLGRLEGRPLKVDLGHEVRTALAALPGREIRHQTEVTAGQRLELGWGAPAPLRWPLTFRIRARVGGGEFEELWESRLEPGGGGAWHQAAIPLDRFDGQRILLTLTTEGGDGSASGGAPAFWAVPEIVEPAAVPPLNVLLVSVDTLRADRLSAYGYGRETSPRLDAWAARRATLFRRVVAAAPWTLPSHVSMLTGLDAIRHGVNHDVGGVRDGVGRFPNGALEMLAEVLWRRGYATAAFTGGAYLHPKYGFAQGFDRYAYWPDRARARSELESGVDRALEWMASQRERSFFCLLHTYAVHDPYLPRQPYFDRWAPPGSIVPDGEVALRSPPNDPAEGFRQHNHFILRSPGLAGGPRPLDGDDRPLIDALYDSGVAYADAQLGRLLDGLEELGLGGRTVVVITSDHGEGLGEEDRAGHVDLYDATLLVPLLIALPDGRGAGRVVEPQVRSIDLFPTILAALGVESPGPVDGVSLLPRLDGAPAAVPPEAWSYSAAASYGLSLRYRDRWKYVFNNSAWPPIGGREELYDLRRDPGERINLAAAEGGGETLPIALLRARARELWEQRSTGLELRISNASQGTLRGEVEGAMVRPVGTKSPDLGPRYLVWREIGRASFEMPAGASFTLHFEKVFDRRMRLAGALDAGGARFPFDAELELVDPLSAAVLRFDGRAWETAGGGPAAIGFEARWRGPPTLYAESPALGDPELRRQLEALGYLR